MLKNNKNQIIVAKTKTTLFLGVAVLLLLSLYSVSAEVTNSTYVAGTGEAIVYFGLNGVLVLFLAGCFLIFLNYNNLLAKVGSLGMGYLLLIAISFVSWQMANDFVTSAFLIGMFRIIFFVLIAGAFPLLIGGFVWYFLMLFKIKEIQNMMKHGMTEYEATDRISRRKR